MSPRAICPPHFVEGAAALKLSPAIWSRGHVFLTGVTGSAPDGTISGDPHTQFRAVFEKVSATLAAAGIDFGSVVEMTSYHIDITTHSMRLPMYVRITSSNPTLRGLRLRPLDCAAPAHWLNCVWLPKPPNRNFLRILRKNPV